MSQAPWLARLAPDPGVPARDAVLDPAAVAGRLPALLGLGDPFTSCRLVRAKYRIGESVRGVYRVGVAGSEYLVGARSFRNGDSADQFDRAAGRAVPTGPLAPVAHEPDLGVVWWTFPNDRRMRGLDVLQDPDQALGGEDWLGWTTSDIVQLVPERSVTARALDRDGHVVGYAKVYSAHEGEPVATLAERHERFAAGLSAAGIAARAPRVLAWSEAHRIVLQEPMPGLRWADVGAGATPRLMRGLGEALAVIHNLDTAPFAATGLRAFARLTPARVRRCAELVATARPDVAAAAERVGNRLAGSVPTDLGPECVLHGDVHPGNALLDGDRVAIIDTDQTGLGPAGTDIASLIARMRFGAAIGQWDPATAEALVATFLAGYREGRALPDADGMRWLIGAALVAERALRAVNRVHPEGLAHLDATLALAERALEEDPW